LVSLGFERDNVRRTW